MALGTTLRRKRSSGRKQRNNPVVDAEEKKAFNLLNSGSAVSVGLLMSIIGGVWFLGTSLSSVKQQSSDSFSETKAMIVKQETALEMLRISMNGKLDTLGLQSTDRFTKTQMQLWTTRFQRDNPTLKIPEP